MVFFMNKNIFYFQYSATQGAVYKCWCHFPRPPLTALCGLISLWKIIILDPSGIIGFYQKANGNLEIQSYLQFGHHSFDQYYNSIRMFEFNQTVH